MFSRAESRNDICMNATQHLAVNQIEGARLQRAVRRMIFTLQRGMSGGFALHQPAGVSQGMRQRAMLRKQQQRNQRTAQPMCAQG